MYLRQDTIKLWEENIDRTLLDINCSKISLDLSPKAKRWKVKINKWDLIKLKSFFPSKGNHQQNKQTNKKKPQSVEWEKIFANNMTNRQYPKYVIAHTTHN